MFNAQLRERIGSHQVSKTDHRYTLLLDLEVLESFCPSGLLVKICSTFFLFGYQRRPHYHILEQYIICARSIYSLSSPALIKPGYANDPTSSVHMRKRNLKLTHPKNQQASLHKKCVMQFHVIFELKLEAS